MTGYRLKRLFSSTPAGVYRPSPGALYPALRRLVNRGLLSLSEDAEPRQRPQKTYQVTRQGRAAHAEWLREPVDRATVANDLGLLIMRFALMDGEVERKHVLGFLDDITAGLEEFIAGMERYLATEVEPGRRHGTLALEHGIAVHRASLEWAKSARVALEEPRDLYTLRAISLLVHYVWSRHLARHIGE